MRNKEVTVREVALEALLSIEKNQAYSHLLLNSLIKKYDVREKDKGLLTELVYGTLQNKRRLDFYLRAFIKKKKVEQWVEAILLLSLYQMKFLDRIPDRAVIHEAVELAKKRGHKGIASFVNGVLRSVQREGMPPLSSIENDAERLAVETSHPLWLINRWIHHFGFEEAKEIAFANLQYPKQTARINRLKTTREEIETLLKEEQVTVSFGEIVPHLAIEAEKGNLANTNAFQDGMFTIQDESSMLVGLALNVKEGDIVLDSCAAPGGKTTHVAEQLNNTGVVHAFDLHEHKIKLIDQQASRLGLTNIEAKNHDARKLSDLFSPETFDCILVDAPCTGLGVIRRKPDIKYSKTEHDIVQLARIQQEILTSVAPLLKKGGTLVYSTCTIDKEENHRVIEHFLTEHEEFFKDEKLVDRLPNKVKPFVNKGELQMLPHLFGTDGFYIASLRKKV
ncbi:16S rRNA (cytosine(967)-C(5))-methyltransferase RsmB [Bacillus carboniphilus]|uniref:16S rRNA (cytosine(967)-C(5))-methyltransferase n=1 Tax=Bacillus carboniphilus TaxID=86663 RepID=A0ABY9JZ11_9BACI|nr:16S rRNA (cytosine(967)-C(5))-methyltransferase RsmB [Bacillus carboniphilus]WLR43578.1 16S rRNA (cytosine(967)-C(5))-methyltransferase RsmB [Bacillus carboniphilus]